VSDRLAGVRAKIERANEHISDLESRFGAFRDTEPYRLRTKKDANTGEIIYYVEIRSDIPEQFSVIAGESLSQLRSSLDHLTWQLIEANGNVPRRPYFPICETAAKYEANSRAMVEGVSAEVIGLMDAIQPYQGGYAGDFWKLHELNNVDKHRRLLVPIYGQKSYNVVFPPNFPFRRSPGQITVFGPASASPGGVVPILEDGTEVARASASAEGNVDLQAIFEIAFREPEIVKGQSVIPFLHQLSNLVDSTVDRFIPYL
jgi:hypothetical protein